jgi:hypothetical protein
MTQVHRNGSVLEGERATDRDFWARLDLLAKRYKLVWAFWTAISVAGGWVIKTYLQPLTTIPTLQAQQIVILRRLDRSEKADQDRDQILKVFGKIICKQMSADDRYKYDVKCSELPPPEIKTPEP